jgi:response regulator of citrate/malate metabolism
LIKVLGIDDDNTLIFILKRFLQKTGKVEEIRTAGDGKSGIDILKDSSWKPDLIFLDINMPVMSGWDFLDEFCSKYSGNFDGEIVMLSSSTIEEEIERANSHPKVHQYMIKPIEYSKILAIVTEMDERTSNLFS